MLRNAISSIWGSLPCGSGQIGECFTDDAHGAPGTVSSLLSVRSSLVTTVAPRTSIANVLSHLVREESGAVAVASGDGRAVGVITDRDITAGLFRYGENLLAMPASRLMRDAPTASCHPADAIGELMARMIDGGLTHVLVVKDGTLCGIVNMSDVLRHRLDEIDLEARLLHYPYRLS